MRKIVLFTSMILTLWACSNDLGFLGLDKLDKSEKPLQIITRILTTKSTGLVEEFPYGATIGLHVTSGNPGNVYNDISSYKNVKVTAHPDNGKITWQQTPEIRLNAAKATLYAYSPYRAGIDFNASEIPVKIEPNASETNDYMYGTHAIGQKAVNNASPVILLSMNHALSLVSFQLRRIDSEKGAFIVYSVQVGNKPGGSTLSGEGTMNIKTGEISATTTGNRDASTLLSPPAPITLTNTFGDILRLKVLPTTKPMGMGEVEALFSINGQTYRYEIPANTRWIKGNKYLYKLGFNGKSLQLEDIRIEDWLPGNRECNKQRK